VIDGLKDDYRCIAPDQLTLGDSERSATGGIDFTSQAQMVLDLAHNLGVGQFHLVGNDSGGAISQIIACAAPERALSLTLTNCDVDENVPPPTFAQAVALARAGLFSRAMSDMLTNLELARSDFGLGVGFEHKESITPELVDTYIAPTLATDARAADLNAYVAAFEPKHLVAIRGKLKALNVPTQLLWGTEDIFFTLKDADWLARTIPGFRRLEKAQGARLFFAEERPEWIATHVREFAAGLTY
jgi:pimeloyl-ACP methyl ester carboxylesterase